MKNTLISLCLILLVLSVSALHTHRERTHGMRGDFTTGQPTLTSMDSRSSALVNGRYSSEFTVFAGADQTKSLPVKSLMLQGQVSSENQITSIKWTELSGLSATIAMPTSLETNITDLAIGTYSFQLTATDVNGVSKSDTVNIKIIGESVPAKTNKRIIILGSSTASGYGLQPGQSWADQFGRYIDDLFGSSMVMNLAKASAPTYTIMPTGHKPPSGRPVPDTNANITKAVHLNPHAIILNFPSNDISANYSIEEQKANFSTIKAIADSANIPIWVATTQPRTYFTEAQRGQLIVMRDWITDQFGAQSIDFWSEFATPDHKLLKEFDQGDGTHLNAAAHRKLFSRVTNSGVIASITNERPVANAGNDVAITLPINKVRLDGSASDTDGRIVSYFWDRYSGSGNITNPEDASTEITGLVAGVSVFRLTVTDNDGGKGHAFVRIYVNQKDRPVANAGSDVSISSLLGRTLLDASQSTGTGLKYEWSVVSGAGTIIYPSKATTIIQNVTRNTVVRLKVTDKSGLVGFDEVNVTVQKVGSDNRLGFNANTFVPAIGDTMLFRYGTNLGYFGNGWTDTMLARLIKDVGGITTRSAMTDWLVTQYSINTRVPEYKHITGVIGLKDIAMFIGEPHATHRDSTVFDQKAGISKVFANLYTPIWKNDGTINENNYFAKYVQDVVLKYGEIGDVKFWEVVNEPDFTYYFANSYRSDVNGWWYSEPRVSDLPNLGAPIYYYIRMLRVAYEVIKKHYPDSYVTPGGIGYEAFLDVLLRYTDNPDGGKITSDYPLTAGAYFDCLSYHSYPHNHLSRWSNDVNGFVYFRHSDAAVTAMFDENGLQKFKNVFARYGYDGSKYPKKPFILSEYNIPRKMFETRFGGDVAQRNYVIKALVKTQQHGILQSHIFALGEHADYNTNFEYDLMGLYENLERDKHGQQKLTMEGKAFKTTAQLLFGWRYDDVQTKKLKLPKNVDGAAFKKGEKFRYVLWAKTTTDMSEDASEVYSFPSDLGVSALDRFEWDYADNKSAASFVGSDNIQLSATPSFFEPNNSVQAPQNKPPVAKVGKDVAITLPANTATLSGSGTDEDGKVVGYKWTKKSGPSGYHIVNSNSAVTDVTNLAEGIYQFELTVTDDKGATGSAVMKITVNPPINKPPVASVIGDVTVTLPVNKTTLSGSGTDEDGTVVSYKWTRKSGPSSYRIVNINSAVTDVTDLVEGVYYFELTVTDNKGATGSAVMKVTVNAAGNKVPVVNAGPDVTITLPLNSVQLSGSASDPDGHVVSYQWTKSSGPSSYQIAQPAQANTRVTGLVAGVYVFQLKVTDNEGASATAFVKVTVIETNIPPKADAGDDITTMLPQTNVTLNGNGSDDDGEVVAYRWTQVTGPSRAIIETPDRPVSEVRELMGGNYRFVLTVTDNRGATGSDTMWVTVTLPRLANFSSGVRIYPNPTTGISILELIGAEHSEEELVVIISDVTGKVFSKNRLTTSGQQVYHEKIDLSGFPNGSYLLTLRTLTGKVLTTRQIIKAN